MTVMFSENDISLFANASHDKNPLHCNHDYARKTPFGEQVVHGILGVLSCFEQLFREKNIVAITSFKASFLKPLFINIDYHVKINKITDTFSDIGIYDGETNQLRLCVEFDNSTEFEKANATHTHARTPHFPNDISIKENCAVNYSDDIKEETIISGKYDTQKDAKKLLLDRFNLNHQSFCNIADLLMWSSYFIGMEMPGQQALYSKIEMNFPRSKTAGYQTESSLKMDKEAKMSTALQYAVKCRNFDDRFNLLNMDFECFILDSKVAYGKLSAFVRQKIEHEMKLQDIVSLHNKEKLRGKTALITGASRGFGSILARILSAMSCHIIANFQHSFDDAIRLKNEIESSGGTIELWQGDISDIDWLKRKKQELIDQGRSIDILICNAFQPPKEMKLEEETVSRINNYIQKNFEMTSIPISLFTPLVNNKKGYVIVISSIAVNEPVSVWPHYIGAKQAIEGLVSSASISYKNINWFIVRPPKLLTDMTNSPASNFSSCDPVLIAKTTCEQIFVNEKIANGINIIEPKI